MVHLALVSSARVLGAVAVMSLIHSVATAQDGTAEPPLLGSGLGGHPKSGQLRSLQNRPVGRWLRAECIMLRRRLVASPCEVWCASSWGRT